MRVLVIDDSAFMRKIISEMIDQERGFEVIGTARDGEDGVQKAIELKPDLITLDIEMPKKDGLTALREIKARCHAFNPAVLMCSSLTVAGSQETLKALRIGAADFIAKDPAVVGQNDEGFRSELIAKLRALRGHRDAVRKSATSGSAEQDTQLDQLRSTDELDLKRVRAIVVGSSTGGPPVLEEIFSQVPANLRVPIIVAQHMPEIFTKSLAERLDQQCACKARLATNGTILTEPGIYIAQGGSHIRPTRIAGGKVVTRLVDVLENAIYRPSVDHLFSQAADIWGEGLLAIQLTGMGADGAEGAGRIRARGGQVIAQSPETCVVYGMPKAVVDAGHANALLAPKTIRDLIAQFSRVQLAPSDGLISKKDDLRRSA